MSIVLLEFQGGEICQRGWDFVKGGSRPPLPPPINEALNGHVIMSILSIANVGSCHIMMYNSPNHSLAISSYNGHRDFSTNYYSCITDVDNCDYEVHVIGIYKARGYSDDSISTGNVDLYLDVTGNSSRLLVLVLSAYNPNHWTLHVPRGVVVHKVIVVSLFTLLHMHDNSCGLIWLITT